MVLKRKYNPFLDSLLSTFFAHAACLLASLNPKFLLATRQETELLVTHLLSMTYFFLPATKQGGVTGTKAKNLRKPREGCYCSLTI
jgi:hypothetical protein